MGRGKVVGGMLFLFTFLLLNVKTVTRGMVCSRAGRAKIHAIMYRNVGLNISGGVSMCITLTKFRCGDAVHCSLTIAVKSKRRIRVPGSDGYILALSGKGTLRLPAMTNNTSMLRRMSIRVDSICRDFHHFTCCGVGTGRLGGVNGGNVMRVSVRLSPKGCSVTFGRSILKDVLANSVSLVGGVFKGWLLFSCYVIRPFLLEEENYLIFRDREIGRGIISYIFLVFFGIVGL